MILYIDTYISETALSPNRKLENFLKTVQQNSYVYRKQSKIDILKYSIASYVPINWSLVIIRIDGDLTEGIHGLKNYIKGCFPKSDVMFERSDTGNKYAEVLDKVQSGNPWVFFSPNNDHPFIYKNPGIFDDLLISAEKAEKKYNLPVSILYSHFTESINSISPKGYLYGYTGDFCEVVDEDEFSFTVKYDHLSLLSLQIFRAEYLYEMMKVAGNNRVIRTECLGEYQGDNYNSETLMIVPKVELCRHYDAYMHTSFVVNDFITASRVPPLFIPDHFFEKKIKIRYGFDEYSNEYININPQKKTYSFDSEKGTDLAIFIEDLPAFWKDRVDVLEISPEIKPIGLNDNKLLMDINNPWRNKSGVYRSLVISYRRFYYHIFMPTMGKRYSQFRNLLSQLNGRFIKIF
jgi:hypothetical protein